MLGSTGMSTFGSPRAGLKKELDSLFNKVQEHEDAIVRLDATIEKNAAIADDSLKAVQASLKASLASLRDEMNRKLQAITIEIAGTFFCAIGHIVEPSYPFTYRLFSSFSYSKTIECRSWRVQYFSATTT